MKIILISSRFYPFTGGVESVVLNLAKEFKEKGHEVLVVDSMMGKAQRKNELVEGIEVRRIWMNLPRSLLGYIAFPLRFGIGLIGLIKQIKEFGPDVINYHFPDDSSVYVWLTYLLLKKPGDSPKSGFKTGPKARLFSSPGPALILNIHGNDLQVFGKKPWYRFFLKKLIKRAKTVVVNSTYIKSDLQENFPIAKDNTKIIPNAVD